MPSAVESNTTLLPAAGYRWVELAAAGLDVEQHLEGLVVDLDQFGGVLALVVALGDDGGEGLADVADDVAGQQRAGRGRVEGRRHGLQAEVGGGVDGHDPRGPCCGGRVDGRDAGVRHHRAGVGHMEGALEQRLVHVVDVHAARREELRILLADHAVAEDAAGHVAP